MPLIDLKTDLKSLKFGRDKRGGGSSNQPYIQRGIPETRVDADTGEVFYSEGLPLRSGPDFLLRNGFLAPADAATDVSRLTQMFFDLRSPNGPLFIAKENLLSRTAPKTETSKGVGTAMGNVNAGVYTPLNTIAQAAVGFAGGHLNLLGLDPTGLSSGALIGYDSVSKTQKLEENQEEVNRLVALKTNIEQGTSVSNFNFIKGYNLNEGVNLLSYSGGPGAELGIGSTNIKFADQRTQITSEATNFSQFIRPAIEVNTTTSKFGVTTIASGSLPSENDRGELTNDINPDRIAAKQFETLNKKYSKTPRPFVSLRKDLIFSSSGSLSKTYEQLVPGADLFGTDFNLDDGDQGFRNFLTSVYTPFEAGTFPENSPRIYDQKTSVFTQQNIIDADINGQYNANSHPADFRTKIREDLGIDDNAVSSVLSISPNYQQKTKNKRLNQGDPGSSNTREGIKNVYNYGIDASEAWALDKITAMPMYDGVGPRTDLAINDLVKFRIAAINNDRSDGQAVYMHFRAFLDTFNDSYTATWNEVKYVGRGEGLYNYGGFGRTLGINFTVPAQSKAELVPMYKKLNYLASTLAPDYNSAGFMRGNLLRLTVGAYLYEQPGFITSLTYDVPQESSWEIAINEKGGADQSVAELPFMIRVNMGFQPVHNFLPQKPNDANNPDERYIAMSRAVGSRGLYANSYREYLADGDGDNNNANNIPGE